jgi:hypothetical protein
MGPFEYIIHTFGFMAPAWGVALFCVVFARMTARWWLGASPWSWVQQTLVSGLLGSGVLAGGLVLWGADGKMATYAALVLVCATTQWLMCRGWQR